ncbi:hypothetical protein pEaSNUABM37_00339 [Erwinia phage pEa_SNUABM_37]|nr:hypothetical protein pEaSNUABM37_00339 [Erwinia phage pEa_SNUABM_37]QXO10807.1 hypothetical protein pEaSNUABM48_00339 [Erwinia phage pEa_SNUABM_48]
MKPAKIPYLYEYPLDFTPYAKDMAAQAVGQPPTQALADALATLTGHPWTLEFQKPYTLYGAKIFYRGPNLEEFATSNRFAYCIGVQLSTYYFSKKLYLVFNILK